MRELELESIGEFEDMELESFEMEDFEDLEDFEGHDDHEDFEDLEKIVGRPKRSRPVGIGLPPSAAKQKQRKIVRQAVRAAGKAVAGKSGAVVADKAAVKAAREAEMEAEYEMEAEGELEAEFENAGGSRQVLDQMRYLAARAAAAESEAEADQFLGALAGLAGKFLPKIIGAAKPLVGKLLSSGTKAIGRVMSSNSARSAIKALPDVVARTAVNLSNDVRRGRPITWQRGVATLSGNAARTFLNRRRMRQAQRTTRRGAMRCARWVRMPAAGMSRRRY